MSVETHDHILEIWQPSSARPLTAEDGREIASNVVGFFAVLARWAEQDALAGSLDRDGVRTAR